ncbi:helix-turn-helix domain-containing protein [Streptacidiphilus sp. N1-10]|uniref:Helix-turn-helix domain-containing protein n=1 Tax=Streptacidiphilus jeojiensis TaxID=3229225 RepID=A0ABV6XS59_9ACTN
MLESVGLSVFEEQVYRTLLQTGSTTAVEVAAEVGCSLPRARAALSALAAAGVADRLPGRPAGYSAVDPQIGLAALIRSRRSELDLATRTLAGFSADYHERMLSKDPHRLVELLEGPALIGARLSELLAAAEQEVLAFDTPPYVTADHTASRIERDLLERGVRARAIYASEVLLIPERVGMMQELAQLGEQARVLPRVPMKMVVVDGRNALIPLTASVDGIRTTAALVHRSSLCDALVELFETHWSMATPVFAPAGEDAPEVAGRHPEVSRSDQDLLHLLNAGLKDDAIARQLGLSERTLRRRITDLTVRLGATSRFQAGAQATRRGWI